MAFDNLVTSQKAGMSFEDKIYDELCSNFNKGFKIRREKEIIDEYGKDISGIDFEIFNIVKTKDKTKNPSKHVFIQTKWQDKTSSITNINHFIKCSYDIIKLKEIDENNVLFLWGSKMEVSAAGKDALSKLKNGKNIHHLEMDECIFNLINCILEFYDKKQLKKQIIIDYSKYDEKFNYETCKKAELIQIVVEKFNYKKSVASKLKSTDLINIITNKNDNKSDSTELKSDPIEVDSNDSNDDEIIMKLEYDEPTKRNMGENKSKLLKIGSDLYNHLSKLKNILRANGFPHQDRMGLHTEVLNNNESNVDTFLSRVASLEGRKYNIKDHNNYDVVGRAITFILGDLEGYEKDAKITIAFLPDKDPKDALKIIYQNL